MATLHKAGGVAAGAGGTVALRVTMDEPGADRFSQPSVLYGLGTGLGAGALEVASMMGFAPGAVSNNAMVRDFLRTHAASATVGGALSAVLPKPSTGGTQGTPNVSSFFSNRRNTVKSARHGDREMNTKRNRESSNGHRQRDGRHGGMQVESRR